MVRLTLALAIALVGQSTVKVLRDGEAIGTDETKCVVVSVHHVVTQQGFTCVADRAGETCRDLSHWSIAVGVREFDGGALAPALDQLEHLTRRNESVSSGNAAVPSTAIVLWAGRSAPTVLVQRVIERCHTIGVGRIVDWIGERSPTRVDELHVSLSFDPKSMAASRRFGTDELKSDEELTARVKAARERNESEGFTVTLVTIDAEGLVDWSFTQNAAEACRRAGVRSVEIVRSRRAGEADAVRKKSMKHVDPATAGTISGTIRFEGTPPRRIPVNMTSECAKIRAEPLLTEDLIVTDGKVQNAFLQLDVPAFYEAPAAAAVLEAKGCAFVPHVMGIQAGQPLNIRNSDPFLHTFHTMLLSNWLSHRGAENNIALSKPGERTLDFGVDEGLVAIKCDVHPWARAYVVIVRHPFFAISAADGSFTIKNVPPGEYDLIMHHEKQLADQIARVKVATGATATQDFVLKQ